MTSYRGICVLRLENGTVIDVQVEDTDGIGLTIDPQTYRQRGVQPPIENLPPCGEDKNPKVK